MTQRSDDLLDLIYEAAFEPAVWQSALDRIAGLHGFDAGSLFTVTKGGVRWTASEPVRRLVQAFIEDGLMARNPRTARYAALDHAGFVSDLDLFTLAEIEGSDFYQYLRGQGYGWFAGTAIHTPTNDVIIFSWDKRTERGPADRAAISALDALRPHLARSALLSARLGLERARAAAETLGLLGLPAAVLADARRIIATNDLVRPLMPSVLQDRSSGVRLTDGRANSLLQRALDAVSDARLDPRRTYSVAVAARDESPAKVVHVIPMRGSARDVFSRASALLVVTSASTSKAPPPDLIRGLFDLTPAESKVAKAICEGKAVAAIAAEVGTLEGTVRTQIRAVFGKTGVSRQVDLVRLLSGLSLQP